MDTWRVTAFWDEEAKVWVAESDEVPGFATDHCHHAGAAQKLDDSRWTVALKGSGFIAEVSQREDSLLWEVTRENRDGLPTRILAWLERRGLPE
jgi:Domain of unknown function (DUF1902)